MARKPPHTPPEPARRRVPGWANAVLTWPNGDVKVINTRNGKEVSLHFNSRAPHAAPTANLSPLPITEQDDGERRRGGKPQRSKTIRQIVALAYSSDGIVPTYTTSGGKTRTCPVISVNHTLEPDSLVWVTTGARIAANPDARFRIQGTQITLIHRGKETVVDDAIPVVTWTKLRKKALNPQ